MATYKQGKAAPAGGFKLSSNENPYPPLPSVIAALEQGFDFNRYPDGGATDVTRRLAADFECAVDRIMVGPGSITILQSLVAAVAGRGDEIVYPWRSFEGYPNVVAINGATPVTVPLLGDCSHDLDGMLEAITPATRAVLLCSPNNPTGNVLHRDEVERFLSEVPSDVLVILDEAYIEFVSDDRAVNGLEILDDHPNLAVVRTFSKAYGLAGLRIGFAVSSPEIIAAAKAASLPLAVSSIAQRAALASLEARHDLLKRVGLLVALRNRVLAGLVAQGWHLPDSQGNFVWLPTGEHTGEAEAIFGEHGIITRAFAGDGIRVSIGEEESVEPLLSASAEVVGLL